MIEGVVLGATSRRGRGRLRILTARVADDTGEIKANWFNQPWLEAQLTPGTRVRLRGKPSRFGFQVASYDLGEVTETADYAPVYPASEALAQKQLRALVGAALELARAEGDALPATLATAEGLPLRADALVALHRPRSPEEAELGRRRLAFDELLVLQLALARRAAERELLVAEALPPAGDLLRRYREVLPFTLTDAQERAIAEIDRDLARTTPMQRLLQGDVGSGKTVVALATLLRAVEAGRQGALMAPTEVLAEQHFLTIEGICTELGVRVALLTSALARQGARERPPADRLGRRADRRRHARADPEGGRLPRSRGRGRRRAAPLRRRAALGARRGAQPARPPHDRDADPAHARAHGLRRPRRVRDHGSAREPQADRHRLGHRRPQLRGVRAADAAPRGRPPGVRRLPADRGVRDDRGARRRGRGRAAAPGRAEGVLASAACTGGCKPAERRAIMAAFKAGEIDVLVATTVIEVGVDVPNATIMIVQEADRFGLAQLHQLRGRVGRGAEQSYCLLVSGPKEELTDVAHDRLEAMVATTRRLRARRARPRDPRRGPAARRAAVGPLRPPLHAAARRTRACSSGRARSRGRSRARASSRRRRPPARGLRAYRRVLRLAAAATSGATPTVDPAGSG